MTKVVVLLATYNGAEFIEEQLESILDQKGVDVSLIINDDRSLDSTFEKLVGYCSKYKNIFLTKNHIRTGSAANNFLQMIRDINFDENFDFVSFSDQDDLWLPEKLLKASELLYVNKADLYYSNLTKWDIKTGKLSLLKKDYPQKEFDYLFEGGSGGCTYLFTKKFAKELSLFLKNVNSENWKNFSHDWLIYFFARLNKYKVVADRNSYIKYRIHSNNVHGHLNVLSWKTIKNKVEAVFLGYYSEHAKKYILYLDPKSEAYSIYQKFLGNYWSRNYTIFKYNTRLMRDKKKFLMFTFLNLLKVW